MAAELTETEVKVRVHSAAWAMQLLHTRDFVIKTPRHLEINSILDDQSRSLRSRGELVRVRHAAGTVTVTFKGPAQVSVYKSREEIEFTTSSLPATLLVLERLGFREYFRYEKFRTEYRRLGDPGVVTLDETPIGEFLEIEGPDSWIDSTARKLGFDRERYLTASYGRLFLAWCQEHGVPPGNMVFATATGDE